MPKSPASPLETAATCLFGAACVASAVGQPELAFPLVAAGFIVSGVSWATSQIQQYRADRAQLAEQANRNTIEVRRLEGELRAIKQLVHEVEQLKAPVGLTEAKAHAMAPA